MTLRLSETPDGASFAVKVVPGSSRDRIVGLHGDLLKVTVTAPPERGQANDAVVRLLAAALGLPPRAVAIVAGHGSPRKQVLAAGIAAAEVRRRLGFQG